MTARWFTTYFLQRYDEFDVNRIGKSNLEINTGNEAWFRIVSEAIVEPSRAFKSISQWYPEDKEQKKGDQTLDPILQIASGAYIQDSNTYKPTGELVLQSAALAMVGGAKDLLNLVNNFPNGVKKIMLSPTPADFLQIGYARVAKKPKAKYTETETVTVVIVAPQESWWDRANNGKKRIHTKQGWQEFEYTPTAQKPTKYFPTDNLAAWLAKVDKSDPWVFVENGKNCTYWG